MSFTSLLAEGRYIHALQYTRLLISPDESRAQGWTARWPTFVDCPQANLLGFWPRWPSDAMVCVLSQAFALELTTGWRRMSKEVIVDA